MVHRAFDAPLAVRARLNCGSNPQARLQAVKGSRLQVYQPMEMLFVIAAFTTLAENFLPQLIAIPRVRGLVLYPAVVRAVVGRGTVAHSSTNQASAPVCVRHAPTTGAHAPSWLELSVNVTCHPLRRCGIRWAHCWRGGGAHSEQHCREGQDAPACMLQQGGAAVPGPCALGAAGGGSECGALHAVPHLRHRRRTLHLQRQGAPLTDSTTGGSMQRQPPPLPGALVRGLLVSARDPAAAGRLVTATCEEGGSRRDVHVRRQPQVVRHECPSAWPNLVPCALHALIADASLSSPIWTRQ